MHTLPPPLPSPPAPCLQLDMSIFNQTVQTDEVKVHHEFQRAV
jgi:hypothetical protein